MRVWTWDNPVVTKEFRGRMRGTRAYWLLFGYLLLLSLTLFVAYLQWWNTHAAEMAAGGGGAAFTIGRTFYLTLFYVQAILVTLITPALTAGAISIEREQRTFEMLRATTLPPRAIALGKLASSVAFVVLLLTSSLPLVSLCFLLGGVSPGEVFFGYLLLVADAFLFGAIGLAWSAHAANTATATALTYGSVFVWFAATIPLAAQNLSPGAGNPQYRLGLGALNPVGSVAGAVVLEQYYGWTVAGWIPALALIVALGTLLMLACINRLEDDPAHKAVPLRVMSLAFCGLALFLCDGMVLRPGYVGMFGSMGMSSYVSLQMLTTLAMWAVVLFVPVFVTGEPVRGRSRRLWMAALPSGLPFALVIAALIVAMTFAAASLGHAQGAFPLLWPAAALLATVTVGLGGVGLLLSTLVRSRWGALTALALLMILGMGVPYFSYGTLQGRDATVAAAGPGINTLYLCPWMGLSQLSDRSAPVDTFTNGSPAVVGMAGYRLVPVWVITATVYLVLGAACYGAGWMLLRRVNPSPTWPRQRLFLPASP